MLRFCPAGARTEAGAGPVVAVHWFGMSSFQRVALPALLAAVAVPGICEQRLPDVAGSIRLVRPEGDQIVVVEPTRRAPGERVAVSGSELVELAETLRQAGRSATAILDETRGSHAFFSDGWRRRMEDALIEIERSRASLELARVPHRFVALADRIEDGGRRLQAGAGVVRSAMIRDAPLLSGAFDNLEAGERQIASALAELESAVGLERLEAQPPPADPYRAMQDARRLCASRAGSVDGSSFDRCVERQLAAHEAMMRRYSFTAGVEEPAFNSIRNACRVEWPDDLVARDRCERQRLTEAAAR